MRNGKFHNQLGGVVCEPNQMAVCTVLNGIAHNECLNLKSSVSGKALVNWALGRIIGTSHSATAAVFNAELKMLEAGTCKRAGGAIVTFTLPDSLRAAVVKLRSESTSPVRLKQFRRKLTKD